MDLALNLIYEIFLNIFSSFEKVNNLPTYFILEIFNITYIKKHITLIKEKFL